MKPEETVDYNVKVAWHAVSRMYNAEAAQNDMTTSIGFVLLNINQQAGTPATKIAPLLGLEARSLTRILKSMEDKDLIYRVPDEHDKRLVRIFLTEKGLEKKEVAKRTVKHFNSKVREAIPEEELQAFFRVCSKVMNMIENKEIF
ncbi:MarR family winged helix-turn-helix transcriptional regulator [Pontibacter silvestris]|uniref:MarR family winged helix-turn-helix transcriptional regulator n=1 Tax=Pontibacter silvestris TaxID=2305183 RepID=A0ABW4WVS4_9BACT|nr:MarR family winged helix-turn-helix transcriptional regulator [Pontibacter silvestris]MCC9136431.1 MarR family winged helix-turn-helix transcriptional regulator [Pontibacter silvestris]